MEYSEQYWVQIFLLCMCIFKLETIYRYPNFYTDKQSNMSEKSNITQKHKQKRYPRLQENQNVIGSLHPLFCPCVLYKPEATRHQFLDCARQEVLMMMKKNGHGKSHLAMPSNIADNTRNSTSASQHQLKKQKTKTPRNNEAALAVVLVT